MLRTLSRTLRRSRNNESMEIERARSVYKPSRKSKERRRRSNAKKQAKTKTPIGVVRTTSKSKSVNMIQKGTIVSSSYNTNGSNFSGLVKISSGNNRKKNFQQTKKRAPPISLDLDLIESEQEYQPESLMLESSPVDSIQKEQCQESSKKLGLNEHYDKLGPRFGNNNEDGKPHYINDSYSNLSGNVSETSLACTDQGNLENVTQLSFGECDKEAQEEEQAPVPKPARINVEGVKLLDISLSSIDV